MRREGNAVPVVLKLHDVSLRKLIRHLPVTTPSRNFNATLTERIATESGYQQNHSGGSGRRFSNLRTQEKDDDDQQVEARCHGRICICKHRVGGILADH
jgi:hypothetical protein